MKKIFLTAMLVLFSTPFAALAQSTPLPGPGTIPGGAICTTLRQEVEFFQDQINLWELYVVEAKDRRDKAAQNLAIYEDLLDDALAEEPPRLAYVNHCLTNIETGKAQLANAEAGVRDAERFSSVFLAIYEVQLYFAKSHYSLAGCLPLIP